MLAARSFPRPWCVVEIPGGFRADDASGKRLGYFYFWDDPKALHPLDDVLTVDEASASGGGHRPCTYKRRTAP
jgi:hypothetical protein